MKKYVLSLVLPMSLLVLAACGSDETAGGSNEGGAEGIEEMTIKLSHVVAENTPKHQGALAFKEYVEAESGGAIEVQIYPNSSLFGDQEEYQNLVANNVQFIIPDLSKLVGNNPAFNVPSLPFLFDDDAEAIAFWDGEKGQEILGSLEGDGVTGLYMWPNGGKHVTNNERVLDSPDDFEGLKFRTQGGQVLEAVYTELGAGSESIPFSELYTALDQGVVDGQENTFSNIESKKLDEVQEYMTVMNHTRVDYGIFTNTEFWNGLDESTKELLEAGLKQATDVAREEAASLNENALELMKDREMVEITELSPEQVEEFRNALQPIYDEFEDKIGSDVYDAAFEAAGIER